MGLLSIFQRKVGPGARSAVPQDAVVVAVERARARRRLVGAVVLVLAGVIGFPLLFDTAPRPLPVDIPIEIPSRDTAPPLAAASAARVTKPESGASDPQTGAASRSAEQASAAVTEKPSEPPATVAAEKKPDPPAEPTPAARQADAARAQAALEGKSAPAKPEASAKPADGPGRFVVQVGAFSEAESAREARARVEKLGIKTYTQAIETSSGKRIRVRIGPFDERAEADKVAARLKQAGITSAVRAP